MAYSGFLSELERAGLTIRAFADLLGMNPNSISNYSKSRDVPKHLALIACLLADMKDHNLSHEPAVKRANADKKKARGRAVRGRFGADRQEILNLD